MAVGPTPPAGPIGTPQHPNIPPLQRFPIVNQDGTATPMFMQFLQQLFLTGPTISNTAFVEAVLSAPVQSAAGRTQPLSFQGGTAILTGGAATIVNGNVTAATLIYLTGQNVAGTSGELSVTNRVAGTGFDIASSSAADTRTVAWLMIEPTAL